MLVLEIQGLYSLYAARWETESPAGFLKIVTYFVVTRKKAERAEDTKKSWTIEIYVRNYILIMYYILWPTIYVFAYRLLS